MTVIVLLRCNFAWQQLSAHIFIRELVEEVGKTVDIPDYTHNLSGHVLVHRFHNAIRLTHRSGMNKMTPKLSLLNNQTKDKTNCMYDKFDMLNLNELTKPTTNLTSEALTYSIDTPHDG